MSQYIQFYVKKNETYILVGEFSRNHIIYQSFETWATYEELSPLTKTILSWASNNLEETMKSLAKYEERKQDMIAKVVSFNNSIENKMEVIETLNADIESAEEELMDCIRAQTFITFLKDMIDPYQNKNIELFFGIEASIQEEE